MNRSTGERNSRDIKNRGNARFSEATSAALERKIPTTSTSPEEREKKMGKGGKIYKPKKKNMLGANRVTITASSKKMKPCKRLPKYRENPQSRKTRGESKTPTSPDRFNSDGKGGLV